MAKRLIRDTSRTARSQVFEIFIFYPPWIRTVFSRPPTSEVFLTQFGPRLGRGQRALDIPPLRGYFLMVGAKLTPNFQQGRESQATMRRQKNIFLPFMMLLAFSLILAGQWVCYSGTLDHWGESPDDHHHQAAHHPGQSDPCHPDFLHPLKLSQIHGSVVPPASTFLAADYSAVSGPDFQSRGQTVFMRSLNCSCGYLPLLA